MPSETSDAAYYESGRNEAKQIPSRQVREGGGVGRDRGAEESSYPASAVQVAYDNGVRDGRNMEAAMLQKEGNTVAARPGYRDRLAYRGEAGCAGTVVYGAPGIDGVREGFIAISEVPDRRTVRVCVTQAAGGAAELAIDADGYAALKKAFEPSYSASSNRVSAPKTSAEAAMDEAEEIESAVTELRRLASLPGDQPGRQAARAAVDAYNTALAILEENPRASFRINIESFAPLVGGQSRRQFSLEESPLTPLGSPLTPLGEALFREARARADGGSGTMQAPATQGPVEDPNF